MDILPKRYSEFLEKNYWEKFFRKLKIKGSDKEFFEWYGEFSDYSTLLNTILSKDQKILNIGCGKSLFPEQLYDSGYKNLVNIDYVDTVIQEMQKRSAKKRPEMQYMVMDVFNMTFEDSSFDVVMDKACIDAIYPEDKEETRQNVIKMLASVDRILKQNGKYLCISLLQEHILEVLLDFFQKKNYQIRFYEFKVGKLKFMPFFIEFTKIIDSGVSQQKNEQILFKYNDLDKLIPVNISELLTKIRSIQFRNYFANDTKKLSQGQRFTFDIWEKTDNTQKTPRFTLHIVDSENLKTLNSNSCGVFVVPLGREGGYIYSTEKGNFDLINQTPFSRLIIAIMNPGHIFKDLKSVQSEINTFIHDFIPRACDPSSVPYVTDGDEIGERLIIHENENFIVEEYKPDEETVYRNFVFKSNLAQIQSEVRLKLINLTEQQNQQKPQSLLIPNNNTQIVAVDKGYICFEIYRQVFASLAFQANQVINNQEFKVLILGGGTGNVGKFIYDHIPKAQIECVEIDSGVIQAAYDYFEVPQGNERFTYIQNDALIYIDQLYQQHQTTLKEIHQQEEIKDNQDFQNQQTQQQRDIILIDINNSEQDIIHCPPPQFIEEEFLNKVKKLLKVNGILLINVIVSDDKAQQAIIQKVSKLFQLIYIGKIEYEINKLIVAINDDSVIQEIFSQEKKQYMQIVKEDKILGKKAIEKLFENVQSFINSQGLGWDSTMNLSEYVGNFTLIYPELKGTGFRVNNIALQQENQEELKFETKDKYMEDHTKINKKKHKKKKTNKAR